MAQNIGKRRIVEGALEGGVVFRPQYPNLFAAFWCENEYRLCLFWSGIWYGFWQNYGSVWTYLSFQFQMTTGKKEKYENSKWILRNL